MSIVSPSALRRSSVAASAAVLALAGLVSGMAATPAAQAAPRVAGDHHGPCPAAESLVPKTTWYKHTLAPGVVMTSGTTKDSNGTVNMHVLRVDLTRKSISLHPLMHSIAQRTALSTLAAGHPNLVAATNTGYFDFRTGAPLNPLVNGRAAVIMSTTHQAAVGLGTNGRMESGDVWWSATVKVGTHTRGLVARDELSPPLGISLYTSGWGSTSPVPAHWGDSVARPVVKGVLTAAPRASRWLTVPQGGSLLVANGPRSVSWLSSLPSGAKVAVAASVKTNAAEPFVQAYGVGVKVVATPGVALTGFSCDSANTTQPARTEIGFADGGRTLIIAIVADHPGTSLHGLDENQMSKLMVQLGAAQAFAFDGSGSTELLARVPGHPGLTLENYPADGQERVMPLGLAIMSTPPKAKKKH
jgi:Phosphodiester glycosidase